MVEFVAPTFNGNSKALYKKLKKILPFGIDGEHTQNSESLRYSS